MAKSLLVLAVTKAGFDAALADGRISEDQLVFIQETKEIWTHGGFFPCPYSKGELDEMIEELTTSGAGTQEALETVADRVTSLEEGKVDKVEGKSLVLDTEITKLEGLKSQSETDEIISGINDSISAIEGDINDINSSIEDIETNIGEVEEKIAANKTAIDNHIADKENPHAVTKAQVGLDKVENYAPSEMPVSDATQTELDKKVDKVTGSSLVPDTEIAKLAGLKSQTEINALIEAEETRAKGVESTLTSELAAEVSARQTSDSTLQGLIDDLTERLNTLADSDDTTLDQLSEIVAYIKNNKSLIDGITSGKVSVDDIIDNLTSTATNKPLSANQGKELKGLIDALTINTNTELDKKVDKVTGKGLSQEDFTTALKTKLTNIEEGAQVNKVISVAGKDGEVILAPTDVQLGNVTNDAQVKRSEMGVAKGVATLDNDTKVPVSQLPLVSTEADGAMSSEDKVTLDDLESRMEWLDLGGVPGDVELSGPTSSRPEGVYVGFQYYDTTLDIPVWYNGYDWVDAFGVSANESYPPSDWATID